jgi:hypothetical protein
MCPPAAGSTSDPTYAVDSLLWARWFEAEHDAQLNMVKAHLDVRDNEDVHYKEAEVAFQPRHR